MINLRESHNQYQKLSLLFVTLLGIVGNAANLLI